MLVTIATLAAGWLSDFRLLWRAIGGPAAPSPRPASSSSCARSDNAMDCAALVAFSKTAGPKLKWQMDGKTSMCSWDGVTCSLSGRVSALVAPGLKLKGTLPSEMGQLTEMTSLRLEGNSFTGTLPSEVWRLSGLADLNLANSHFSGTLSSQIGRLTGLEHLELGGYTWTQTGIYSGSSDLSGTLPSEVGQLTGLMSLKLLSYLSGTLPSEVGKLTGLTMLTLSGDDFSGTLPSEVGKLTELKSLQLRHTMLSGTLPSSLCKIESCDCAGTFMTAPPSDADPPPTLLFPSRCCFLPHS